MNNIRNLSKGWPNPKIQKQQRPKQKMEKKWNPKTELRLSHKAPDASAMSKTDPSPSAEAPKDLWRAVAIILRSSAGRKTQGRGRGRVERGWLCRNKSEISSSHLLRFIKLFHPTPQSVCVCLWVGNPQSSCVIFCAPRCSNF